MSLKYVYGPVPSRRFGRSLGVSPIPFKFCNYSCIYCQLGRTKHMTNQRMEFFPREEILKEIDKGMAAAEGEVDYITFAGDGEPTLYRPLGYLIERVAERYSTPVAVLTNGSLLSKKEVREELSGAKVVSPTVDTAREETWKRLNRPHRELNFEDVMAGMISFRDEFAHEIWAEVMMVKGLNDSEEEIEALREYFMDLRPDRVYINVPIRPPAEGWVKPPDPERILMAHGRLRGVELTEWEVGEVAIPGEDPVEEVLRVLRRHPLRREQLKRALGRWGVEEVERVIEVMVKSGSVLPVEYQGQIYYLPGEMKRGGKTSRRTS